MDKRIKIKTAVNMACLIISTVALYAFVAIADVSAGWRKVLIVIAIGWIVSGITNLGECFKQGK